MDLHEVLDCNEMLLDMVCYELITKRLSPEMEGVFDGHLQNCPTCRQKVVNFRQTIGRHEIYQNFG